MLRLSIVLCCLTLIGCDKKTPAPPVMEPPPQRETINGTEPVGWEQPAADTVELAAIGYVMYVDGTRTALASTSCATSPTAATSPLTFACSARLPMLSPGAHTLELASFVSDGAVLESARSAPLRVTVVSAVTPTEPASGPARSFSAGTAVTTDQVRLRIELVVKGIDHPADLAFAPDGRLFLAERSGRIRILAPNADRLAPVDGGETHLPEPAVSLAGVIGADGQLLALALDPQFDRTRFVFAIYTAASRSGQLVFTLARFREVAGTLGDRIVLLDGIPATSPPSASLRFGPDAKLYAAMDEKGDARQRGDAASMHGKILRLNPDGTTPDDQAGAMPLYADGYRGAPGGFDWDLTSLLLWVADRDADGSSRLRTVALDSGVAVGMKRGIVRGAFALPAETKPSSVAVYRGGLFPAFAGSVLVASEEGRHLLRVRLDPQTYTHPVGTEQLLQDRVGAIRAVAIRPDGAVYFGTADAIGRLAPDVP
jgi:glucose/arabinose dehydrogenase